MIWTGYWLGDLADEPNQKKGSVRWGILPQVPHRGINPQAPLKKNYEAYKNFETGPRKP